MSKKITRVQLHYILFAKGWYNSFFDNQDDALNELHKRIYGNAVGDAKIAFYHVVEEFLSLEYIKKIINELIDDYTYRENWEMRDYPKTFVDRLYYHARGVLCCMPVRGETAAVDIFIPFKVLDDYRNISKSFESFYNSINLYYDFFMQQKGEENLQKRG